MSENKFTPETTELEEETLDQIAGGAWIQPNTETENLRKNPVSNGNTRIPVEGTVFSM